MAHKTIFFSLLGMLLVFVACDSVTVDPTGMGINVRLDPNANTAGPGSMQFDSGYIRLSEIEFEGERRSDGETEYKIQQLTTIDLITGASDPALPNMTIPPGFYEEFEVEARGADDGGTVIFFKGTVTDSSLNAIPVVIDVREEFSLELEWENYQVDSTMAFSATFLINPTAWFDTISLQDLQQADRDANGVVVISPNDNVDLYGRLKDLLDEGVEWEWDDDDDD